MRNRAFSSIHCDLRFKFRCDLRSSAEGLGAPAAGIAAKYEFRWSRLAAPQLPRNTNSDGQNSISPCSCYVAHLTFMST